MHGIARRSSDFALCHLKPSWNCDGHHGPSLIRPQSHTQYPTADGRSYTTRSRCTCRALPPCCRYRLALPCMGRSNVCWPSAVKGYSSSPMLPGSHPSRLKRVQGPAVTFFDSGQSITLGILGLRGCTGQVTRCTMPCPAASPVAWMKSFEPIFRLQQSAALVTYS